MNINCKVCGKTIEISSSILPTEWIREIHKYNYPDDDF